MIKNIIFDMGNVLFDYDPQVCLQRFCSSDRERKIIQKELFEGPEWVMGDQGMIAEKDKYDLVKKRVPQEMHPSLKRCAMEWDICMVPLPGAEAFCDRLKEHGYRLFVLSNASDSFYEYFPRLKPLDFFDGIVVSADVHIIKPDLCIYQILLEKYELNPAECLFIDDRADNVQGARAAGMQAEVFCQDYEAVRTKYQLF